MIQRMRNTVFLVAGLALISMFASPAYGQLGIFSKEQRIDLTSAWHGARFPDGRPNVPDSVIKRMKGVTAEEAWGVLMSAGYKNQFEPGWKVINPGEQLVGRVVTAVFMPSRPDLNRVIERHGKAEGRIGAQNSWIIDILKPGDVLVVDLFGKIKDGTIIGDNLGTAIYAHSHNGLIVNGSVRDVVGIKEIKGFQVYTRGSDPSALRDVTLMGINVPIRIGHATVMPGDVALGGPEGITFVPAELAEKVADHAELTHLRDDWGHEMLREEKYTPGEVDGRWTPKMIEEFNAYAAKRGSKLRMEVPK
jgi:4-hydroxy-4-methyl-2-oxoglutarate aldolase